LHPSHQPINLFFDKVKNQTNLKEFKHTVISKEKYKEKERNQYVSINQDHDQKALGKRSSSIQV
jgi:hypothetical protein